VSSLEIARLVTGGLVELKGSLDRWVRSAIDSLEARSIDIDHQIAIEAYKLPGRFHKDPADRLLVATARLRDLTLVTADERILAYRSVRTLDARM
jgi:PIN domain nuclease of toxin-antitoxin system